jgi:hypothetical protein
MFRLSIGDFGFNKGEQTKIQTIFQEKKRKHSPAERADRIFLENIFLEWNFLKMKFFGMDFFGI